jgi:predicted ATPase
VQEQSSLTTFLFTDIEGSTRLWDQQPERMQSALARHDALAREAVESRRGTIVKTTGDGVHAAFTDPLDAVRAAVAFQQALLDRGATADIELRARCGVHVGVVENRNNDYFGSAVNRAARIMTAAHGGQILLSQATAELVRVRLPQGVSLLDLGDVRLRDLAQAERVYQVVHPALRQTFPTLRSLEVTPNNLPEQVTSFIGRERETADLENLIGRSRLVTVVGTGGLGKTRLSVQVAANVIDDFPDGVWLIELAPISEPRLVPQAVASVLGVTETAGAPVVDALLAHVRDRRYLIVLDNCEHLIEACATLARQMLQAGSETRLLATSREALRLSGETVYQLPALALPGRTDVVTPEALLRSDAAQLFIDRAAAVHASFAVTPGNATAIATICRRVDGIPLALELAAARVRALSVETIAARLDDRFRLLTRGDPTALPRQRTLRALIDWSYELLTSDEAALFRRLAVFAGGFTLDAAEALGSGSTADATDVVDALTHLVEKSLVERDAAGDRYRMLDTVRQYALEALDAAGEMRSQRTRHLQLYVAFAQHARPAIVGPQQAEWLGRIDAERENLLAAHGCHPAPVRR